jgi:peroxiredoxin
MFKEKAWICQIILVLLIFSVFINYKWYTLNKHYKSSIPYLLKGEKIPDVDLIDKDANLIDPLKIRQGVSVIFVFLRNCSPCDKNIVFWKKITKLFKDNISTIGIVLKPPTEAFSFAEKSKLNFKIYIPDDLPGFIKDMRLKINQSQTIVLQDGRVKRVKMGDLDAKGATEVIKLLKGLVK